jgi:hypothetical protein
MSSLSGPNTTRRKVLAWIGAAAVGLAWGDRARDRVRALEPEVPVRLQVDLLNRVIPYDRNFSVRVRGELTVAVVVDSDSADSTRIGALLMDVLKDRSSLGRFRHRAALIHFTTASAMAEECKRMGAGIVYFTPDVRASAATLVASLQSLHVMSIASSPEHVAQGLVLGFAVRSGKPRLLVNLTQARRQRIDFSADFLRIAEVVG